MWHAWNVDRLYMAGVQIKHRAHAGLNHQKSVILHDQDAGTRRSDDGDLRLVELDEPVGGRPGRAQHLHHEAVHHVVVHRSVRAQVEQPRGHRRERRLRAAAARRAEESGARRRRHQRQHDADGSRGPAGRGHTSTTFISTPIPTRPRRLPSTWRSRRRRLRPARSATRIRSSLRTGTTYYWRVVGKTMALQGRPSPGLELQDGRMSADCTATSMATAVPTS